MTDVVISPHDPDRVLICGDMLGVALSTDGGDTWQPTFGFKSWEIGAATWHPTDPDTVWVGTMSGPYVSHDGGMNWVEKRQGMAPINGSKYSSPIERVLFDPDDPQRLLAFGGTMRGWKNAARFGDVWASDDGGETWSWVTVLTQDGQSGDPQANGVNIASADFAGGSSSQLYAGTRGGGVMVSEDGGLTWTARNQGLPTRNIRNLVVHPSDPDVLWVTVAGKKGSAGGVYRSDDAGQAWVAANRGLDQNPKAVYRALIVCPTQPNRLFTACWRGGKKKWAIYRSDDGGASWKHAVRHPIRSPYPADGIKQLGVDPNDANRVFGVGNTTIIRTINGGNSWQQVNAKRVGTGWRGTGYSGLVAKRFTFDPYRKGHATLQAMDMGRVWRTTDGGRSWTYHDAGAEKGRRTTWYGGQDVAFAGPKHIYASFGQHGYFSGLGRSQDGGETWQGMAGKTNGLPKIGKGGEAMGIHARSDRPEHAWAIVAGNLYQTHDGGDRWSQVPDIRKAMWITGDPNRPERFYVSGRNALWMTDDGGNSFEKLDAPTTAGRMTVDSLGRLYLAAWRHHKWSDAPRGLWRYDGTQWIGLHENRYIADVAVDPDDPRRIAIATNDHPYHDHSKDSGVWLSSDDGKTWQQANTGLPMTRGEVIAIDPHDPERLVFGSFGAGFFEARWPKTASVTP